MAVKMVGGVVASHRSNDDTQLKKPGTVSAVRVRSPMLFVSLTAKSSGTAISRLPTLPENKTSILFVRAISSKMVKKAVSGGNLTSSEPGWSDGCAPSILRALFAPEGARRYAATGAPGAYDSFPDEKVM